MRLRRRARRDAWKFWGTRSRLYANRLLEPTNGLDAFLIACMNEESCADSMGMCTQVLGGYSDRFEKQQSTSSKWPLTTNYRSAGAEQATLRLYLESGILKWSIKPCTV